MRRFRLHVVGLPHTNTSKRHNACAYTMKVYNFCKMMMSLGHSVYHYGAEGSDCPCSENIEIISRAEQQRLFGDYDFRNELYRIEWDTGLEYWRLANARAADEIQKRKQPHDFLCLIVGTAQAPIDAAVNAGDLLTVEYGVGYYGVFSKYRVFESYAHMHMVYGLARRETGSFYDCVIPNYFDPNDFPFEETKDDYFLYIGRMIKNKGIEIAVQATREAGARLLLAGQGVTGVDGATIHTAQGSYTGEHLEYVGFADVAKRAALLGRARGVFVPTMYMEPFGGVAVEAQLCGTPVITTDWGAFAETVEHGVSGYRCRTLDHFVWAAKNVGRLDRHAIRARALARYSMDRVRFMYQEFFEMLQDLWGAGWLTLHDREQLDWLN